MDADDVAAGLFELAAYWYNTVRFLAPLPMGHIETQWRDVWFAKGEAMAVMDRVLMRYEQLLLRLEEMWDGGWRPHRLEVALGALIAVDQVSRNIYRGTPRSFSFDRIGYAISRALLDGPPAAAAAGGAAAGAGSEAAVMPASGASAEPMAPADVLAASGGGAAELPGGEGPTAGAAAAEPVPSEAASSADAFPAVGSAASDSESSAAPTALGFVPPPFTSLPQHAQFTVQIALVHSERLVDQDYVLAFAQSLPPCVLGQRFRAIAANHRERVVSFGRFPERNAVLGRPSTEAELTFLRGVYS